MIHTNRAFLEAVRRAVHDAERSTSAELVVVVSARSGSYLDIAGALGAVAALGALLVALFIPVTFPPWAVAVEVPLAFGIAAWLSHRVSPLLRVLTPSARARKQVERAAASHFISEAVHGTRGRTGLLLYYSVLEQRIALIPDLGLESRVPAAAWSDVRWTLDGDPARPQTQEDLLRGIGELGSILRTYVPDDGPESNERSDEPRIVP